MKKKQIKKLTLQKETLELLDRRTLGKPEADLALVQGGGVPALSDSLPECCGCSNRTT